MPNLTATLCLFIATLLTTFLPAAQTALAQEDTSLSTPAVSVADQEGTPVIQTRLVGSHTHARPGQTITLAWEFTLAPGWHIYWKNAGDSGLPPELAAEQGSLGPITFPVPQVINIPPLVNYGYENAVTFTLPYTVPDTLDEGEHTLPFSGNFLYCHDACLPGTVRLELPLVISAGSQKNADFRPQQNLPSPLPDGGASATGERNILLTLPSELAKSQRVRFIPSEDGLIEDSAPQTLNGNVLTLRKDIQTGKNVDNLTGILLADGKAYTVDVPFSAAVVEQGSSVTAPVIGLATALVFALLAGLILNLMPCVLPVLSLKVLSLVRHHHGEERSQHAFAYTLGIVSSFWALAAVIGVIGHGGSALGWGFHLQNPMFIGVLAGLMTLIALLFFGVFEVGQTFTRLGSLTNRQEHPYTSFLTGILAVIVATPCTVPFMGGAVAYALAQPFPQGFMVFTAMGMGMALPFLVTATFPKLLGWLPKPGEWMLTFRKLLGWPMLATALWLSWVFAEQTDTAQTFRLFALLLGVALALWLYGLAPRGWKAIATVLLIVAGYTWLYQSLNAPDDEQRWQPWSADTLDAARSTQPVFVDFTADWCVTCKVTEATVLNARKVQDLFAQTNTLLLRGDWTLQDPEITAELARHGRKGVPLYLVYLPGQDQPKILPQIITYGTLREALASAPVEDSSTTAGL